MFIVSTKGCSPSVRPHLQVTSVRGIVKQLLRSHCCKIETHRKDKFSWKNFLNFLWFLSIYMHMHVCILCVRGMHLSVHMCASLFAGQRLGSLSLHFEGSPIPLSCLASEPKGSSCPCLPCTRITGVPF